MKLICKYFRSLTSARSGARACDPQRRGTTRARRTIWRTAFACIALILPQVASAQLTPIWTINHGQVLPAASVRNEYYDNLGFFGTPLVQQTPTIDFNWGFGSPAVSIPADSFSARWIGTISPTSSESYTFFALASGGVRIWVNDQLILNHWVEHAESESVSNPLHLTGGSLYTLRVEFFETTGTASLRLQWGSVNLPKQLVRFQDAPDGTDAQFGTTLAGIGNGRFVVGAPLAETLNANSNTYVTDGGAAWIYDQAGQNVGAAAAPVNGLRHYYGTALATFPDGRVLVGSANSAVGPNGTNASVGSVFLHGPDGALLGEWPNPDGATNEYWAFGYSLAALPGNRFAASSLAGRGKVFVFDATQPGPPLLVITNPSPNSGGNFGKALAALGPNRLLIGDHYDTGVPGRVGSVRIYDYSGNLIRTVRNPAEFDFDEFGGSVTAVDDHRFLVAAKYANVVYFPAGGPATNASAGAVYLFDDTGGLLRTFTGPHPERSGEFGAAIAMLDAGRAVIGAPGDRLGNLVAGRAFLYNLGGVLLGTAENPQPNAYDWFGTSIAILDERRFAIGALYDDTVRVNAGSVYGYDAPLPVAELGSQIPEPALPLDRMGTFPMFGPTVNPPDAAFWHVPSQKLFAVKPGGVLVSWKLTGGDTANWEAAIVWPTNAARFQTHIAGPTPVDVSDSGSYSNVLLQATTSGATLVDSNAQRWFTAPAPGSNLLMLSAGHPTNGPIRFQFVRSVAWNDPACLHDDAPAVIGSPIVDPAGYHNPACGSPQVVLPNGVYAPAPVFDPPMRTGAIIPVNRDRAETENDDLVVGFYQFGTKLYDPVTGDAVANTIAWPHKPVRYRPEWPADAPRLVIASQQGTGPIDPAQFVDWELYFQNNPNQAGFNPNDEHALRRSFGTSEGVFALRDDLGTTNTSEPYVLIRYRDLDAAGQWRIKVWKVVAEEAPFFFHYPAQAGSLIQSPAPLNTLAIAPQSTGVSGPYWRDRKLFFWAKAAGDDGGTAEIVMRYFYPVQPGFFFPGTNPPAVGVNIPLLDLRAGTPGTPIDVRFEAAWPTNVAELRVGETLAKPKNGLPQIAGQSSAEILYQQAEHTLAQTSVRLIDPVRTRSVPLAQLPPDLPTQTRAGLRYFPTLPPHLESRISYDPVARRLQLRGEFVEPPAGESYLLLNVLTPRERAVLTALTSDPAWQTAVAVLAVQAANPIAVPWNSTGFDSLALTAGDAEGTGYVTLAFGNSTNLSAPSDPISLSIIKVTCPLYRGELKVVESPNPLAEQLTLRHSGDFAGHPGDFEFEWRTMPPVDGFPSTLPPEQWIPAQPTPANGVGAVDFTIAGPGLYTLSDNYFICRYRRVSGPNPCPDFSAWTAPMLAEGWIKRVTAGIGPFEQRIQDYQDTQVNTIVSMISQAGARAAGDVALNPDAVNSAGLIEVYETVLRRGLGLSIEGTPPVDYAPANDALLLAAGRLADLYMLLGNEAYADAADPTIAFGTDDGIYGAQATSLHCFMNQTASLLEEELGLLRGRDSSKLPSVATHPVYNRFIWNFTRDINGGEVAYALNYNIRNQNGDVAGTIDEADAKLLYPQGHGDAWGHYLMAIKNYYRLLRSASFTWVPRVEAVIVGGVPVSVDYLDERKFAAAAAARARTGAEIVNLTFRETYVETPAKPWQTSVDSNTNRAWSLGEWSIRAGQGALFDWVVANALLPDVDTNASHTGIQKIERANIRELQEIVEAYRQIQEQSDQGDQGNNPLGLANNVVPFDIDPGGVAQNKTHFEQINERATEALRNAVAVFDHANASTQLLRRQADETTSFQQRVTDSEADFNNRLIELFGTPYTDDIGPAGTYPTGYAGPDIYHYDYVDSPEIRAGASGAQPTLRFDLSETGVSTNGALSKASRAVTFHFSPNGFGLEKPVTWTGQRNAPGELQMSRSALLESIRRLERSVAEYENLIDRIEDAAESFRAEARLNTNQIRIRRGQLNRITDMNEQITDYRTRAFLIRSEAEVAQATALLAAEGMPDVVGLATDAFSIPQATLRFLGRGALIGASMLAQADELSAAKLQDQKGEVAALSDLQLFVNQADFTMHERLRQLEQLVRTEPAARLELAAVAQSQEQSAARYQAALARGVRLLEERTRFRQQTAAQIQTYRYKDMAFRVFRSDALQKYRAQFDLAARYAYLATKAYDYETCLAPGDNRGPGSAFLTSIIRSRSLGLIGPNGPLQGSGSGDSGLADPLARLTANWNLVLKGQLGFNNPQTETGRFSLRNELFRILSGPSGGTNWRQTLEGHVVPNVLALPEFQRHCIPFSPTQPVEPAIVIPFGTTINFGLNFFGWPAGGGDNDYDSTKFATKIRSVGVWFANYNNLGGGMINTPRVYLVPVGLDVMRAPTQGEAYIREWRILDQALPVPFPISGGQLNNPAYVPINDSLNEDFASIRRFGRFRAFHDSGNFNPTETISDSRLIGRSVWNTRWLLIIPAGTLHTDRNEGIQRFINGALRPDGTRDGNGVSDIKIFFQTYAYSGN
jgi:hypothetical protein